MPAQSDHDEQHESSPPSLPLAASGKQALFLVIVKELTSNGRFGGSVLLPSHRDGFRQARSLSSSPTDRSRSLPELKSDKKPEVSSSASSTSSTEDETSRHDLQQTVYVHPLSQIILEYLQDCRHDWIAHHGLDQSLTLHRDGSFVLKFSTLNAEQPPIADGIDSTAATSSGPDTEEVPVEDKIWTSYDEESKKHWLTVHKQSLHQRFLLQDNLLPAWHGNRKSLPERIHQSVESMIRAVDRLDLMEQRQQH